MEVFHIHAGVTSKQIVETMDKYIEQAKNFLKQNKKKRLWIFFDEFNTTPNIGMFKEIICERTFLNELLPHNMVFLGACNPQRRNTKKEISTDAIGIKKYHSEKRNQISGTQSSLLYSVVPIPETMLEHVWDYGFLNKATEKPYIDKILKVRTNLESESNSEWFKCTINLISDSQEYFRKHDDQSSVSLRDVARFCLLYNWFDKLTISKESSLYTNVERATLLALFVCYYFRLNSSIERENYMKTVAKSIKPTNTSISVELLNQLLNDEKMALVNQMKLESGMAINRALTDNIFVLFTCIQNRIPVILSGKPGSSKTSAMKILGDNLKGEDSEKEFFKTKQGIIAISYQGSMSCTSESIIKIFQQADKVRETKSMNNMLPVIVFDEIGLAELSPYNPLKVLHSHLEIENCKYGFVGLSNWPLDASKMNRAVYLSCPEPNDDDLKITAITLSKAIIPKDVKNILLDNDNSVIKGLVAAYKSMYEHIMSENKGYYFGLRDYYALIRGIAYEIIQNKDQEYDLYGIIRHHLSCNFDGIIDESTFIWTKFCEHMKQEEKINTYSSPTFSRFLKQCLTKRNGRFLMLVGDNDSDFDFIQQYVSIKYPSYQIRTLTGSTLAGDLLPNGTYTEQYNVRILTDIIFYTEREVTVFFRGLGHLYDNLYDLFNQNFTVTTKKRYCRIALGSIYHPRCIIHDNFYCIVFVKKRYLNNYDRPFLNRFEKHVIDMNEIITSDQKQIIAQLKAWFDKLVPIKSNEQFPIHKHLLFEFNKDYIRNLTTTDNAIFERCQEQMIRVSSFDFAVYLALKSPSDDMTKTAIQQYYDIHENLSFSSFIDQEFSQKKSLKLLIYTYTQLSHDINYKDLSNHTEWIEEMNLNYFQTELDLVQKLKVHFQSDSIRSKLLCIRLDCRQNHQQISMLKYVLLNEIPSKSNHGVCLIFHLQRHKLNEIENDVYFDGWTRIMIDDLQKHHVIPQNILTNRSYIELIMHLNSITKDSDFNTLVNRCMINLRYEILDKNLEMTIEDRRNRLLHHLIIPTSNNNTNDQSLGKLVREQLIVILQQIANTPDQSQFVDWRQDLFTDATNIGSCISFNDALQRTISICLDRCLLFLLSHLENQSMFDSYVFHMNSKKELGNKLRRLWSHCWATMNKIIDTSLLNQNNKPIPLVVDLHLPCARAEYEIIREIRQTDDPNAELLKKSIYGEFIKEILADSSLFAHYYHDQLTLARIEANTYQLSTSFIHRLLTVNTLQSNVDRLQLLLIDYQELFEILQLYDISIPLIDEQNTVSDILHRQFFFYKFQEDSTLNANIKLYRLLFQDSNYYLISPESSDIPAKTFDCEGNPYIEVSLMNIVELLLSSTVIDRCTDLQQMLITYGRFAQTMFKLLSYGHYQVSNFKKFNSIIRLASCISCLFTNEKATSVFKEIYRQNNNCSQLENCDKIHNFIQYLSNIIHTQQSTANDETIQETLSKLEVELLRNWLFDNSENSCDILDIINKSDQGLWKFSSKLFGFINQHFGLSETITEEDWEIPDDEDIEKLKRENDPINKAELLLINTIYVRSILNENCESKFNNINLDQLTTILETGFDRFKNCLTTINEMKNKQKPERIYFIAWLKYYLLHYVYAYQNNITDKTIDNINLTLERNTTPFCSTIKLYIIKHICHLQNITIHFLSKNNVNKEINWIQSMIPQPSDPNLLHARQYLILPTPLFGFVEHFQRIDNKLSKIKNDSEMKELIQQCSTNQTQTYCFIMWFVHYYTKYVVSNISTEKTLIQTIIEGITEELTKYYDDIGQKLILGLVGNFSEQSYFRLKDSMSEREVRSRLLVLNIIAALISFKSTKNQSFLRSLLFQEELNIPTNYTEHFKQLSNNSLTNHFMNFLLQSVALIRSDKGEVKYNLLEDYFPDIHQFNLWFYNLINQIVNENFASKIHIHDVTEALDELIVSHSDSVIIKIKQYQSAYLDFVFGKEKNNQLITFSNELIEDNDKYSLLNYFNFTNIHLINVVDHFYKQFQLQINYKTKYPITNLIFERLSNYDNIQYLYPIVQLVNQLVQKYDHQIKRTDANKKTIADYLKTDTNLETTFNNCLDAWYMIKLEEVERVRPELQYEVKECNLSMFLLNKNSEEDTMAIMNTIKTLVDLQNNVFDRFYSIVSKSKTTEISTHQIIPIQLIQPKHLFNHGTNKMRQLLIEKALVINYTYGNSEEIIYNYDEIEWTLRNDISCLAKIDMETIRYLNYQFELYDENISRINEMRKYLKPELLTSSKQQEIQQQINDLCEDSIVKISKSLVCILSHLHAANRKIFAETLTIKTFIDTYIQLKECIHEKLNEGIFASIELVHIIDLYELFEEATFDKILRKQIKQKLDTDLPLKSNERTHILNESMKAISNNELAWIGMLKRLLVRVLSLIMNNNYDLPLQGYVRRTDMWKSDMLEESIQTIQIDNSICLKHAYIILERLENDILPKKSTQSPSSKQPAKGKRGLYTS